MSANSKRSENEETAGASNDFESGLDYGAFAEDDPDFPEDHLDAEGTPGEKAASDTARSGEARSGETRADEARADEARADEEASGEGATTAVPRPAQAETRPLDDVTPVGTAASSPADASADAPAGTTGRSSSTADETAALPKTTAGSPAASPAAADSEESISAESQPVQSSADPAPAPVAQSPAPAAPEEEPYRPSYETAIAGGPVSRSDSGEAITDADLDEEVSRDKRGVSRVFQVIIAIFVPLMVTVAAIRLVASPAFLWIAYHRPGFPGDTFGFDTADRLLYGSYGMDYLFNAADSRYLSELAPGGEQLFTEAEVSHMTDVKMVMMISMGAGLFLLLLTLLFALLLRRWRPGGVARGFFSGAWVTLGLIAAGAVAAILSWQQFFDTFHRILFEDGTWTFSPDSTLIRLYPEQFWMDAGIAVVGLVAIIAILTLIITWPTKRRRARRQARLEEVYAIRREKLVAELTKDAEYSNAPKARR
ncbi:TIGR01906 family membrane protein [Nesterenkonia suensis]